MKECRMNFIFIVGFSRHYRVSRHFVEIRLEPNSDGWRWLILSLFNKSLYGQVKFKK
jgi:hypothetical protein